ncbi:membrane frizzled-related protein-like [Liolophura sinensis]|uniref:membrane frizzled-related protein-like n=1 Tax=Liolophura sinensis TaxID=3198878 RepID=UPI003158868F
MDMPRMSYVAAVVLFLSFTSVDCEPVTYYMDTKCDQSISMYSGSALLDLTSFDNYDPNMKCVVSLQSNEQYMNRIMVKVIWMDIEEEYVSCTYDRLMIYDGINSHSSRLTGRYGLCGNVAPATIYRTTGDWVTFNFTSDTSRQGRGFQLLVTGFDDSGICLTSSEYECSNGFCVDEDLECDGYNNCGDNSDELLCSLSVGGIVGISVGCVAGAFILAAIVVLIASRNKTSYRHVQPAVTERSYIPGNGQPYTVYGSPISQSTLPPAYGTLYSPPYPVQGQAAGSKVDTQAK